MEAGSGAGCGFGPDAAAMTLDDTAAKREPNAGAGHIAALQTPKHSKDTFLIGGIESLAIIADDEMP